MKSPGNPFNVVLSNKHSARLVDLAAHFECSKANVVRMSINSAHAMIFDKTPSCADGSKCFVPHMHATASSDPKTP
jgi:hypothetical protein